MIEGILKYNKYYKIMLSNPNVLTKKGEEDFKNLYKWHVGGKKYEHNYVSVKDYFT